MAKGILYSTLSCSEGRGRLGAHTLGALYFHDDAGILERNLYRAKYYFEMAINNMMAVLQWWAITQSR